MPELPEVETSRKGILPFLENNEIISVKIRNARLRWPISTEIGDIRHAPVRSVLRRGKYIIVELEKGAFLLHLGMSGRLRVVPKDTPVIKHDHVDFLLSGDKVLRFNDPRRFGSLLWAEDWHAHPLIASLGPEPLEEQFDGDYLYTQARGKKQAVKTFIMDSHIVVGVGNIYANESLFLAGIHPKRSVSRISKQRFDTLAEQIKFVLGKAIEKGGTTLKDFQQTDGQPGYFAQSLHVYGRANKPCPKCESRLKEVRMGQRSTVYCAQCQK